MRIRVGVRPKSGTMGEEVECKVLAVEGDDVVDDVRAVRFIRNHPIIVDKCVPIRVTREEIKRIWKKAQELDLGENPWIKKYLTEKLDLTLKYKKWKKMENN